MLIYAILWILCGLAGSGFIYADMQGKFPSIAEEFRREDVGLAITYAIFGPIALFAGYLMSGFGKHGWWAYGREKGIRQAADETAITR